MARISLAKRLAGLEDPYLTCRTRRHRFEDIPDDGGIGRKWKSSRTVIRLCQRCERCTTVRYEAWNAYTGEILFAYYKYPAGYAIDGEIKRAQLRKEYLSRAFE